MEADNCRALKRTKRVWQWFSVKGKPETPAATAVGSGYVLMVLFRDRQPDTAAGLTLLML